MVAYIEQRTLPRRTIKVHRSDLSREDFDDAVLACAKSAIRPSVQKIRHIKFLSAELMQLLYDVDDKASARVSARFANKLSMLEILADEVNENIKQFFAEESQV